MLTLNAPHSGPFAGLAIIQDSNGLPSGTTYTSTHSTIGGTPGAILNGLVYFPNSSMTFHGVPSAAGPECLLLVAGTVNIDATSRLEAGGCGTAGLGSLPPIRTLAVAEGRLPKRLNGDCGRRGGKISSCDRHHNLSLSTQTP